MHFDGPAAVPSAAAYGEGSMNLPLLLFTGRGEEMANEAGGARFEITGVDAR